MDGVLVCVRRVPRSRSSPLVSRKHQRQELCRQISDAVGTGPASHSAPEGNLNSKRRKKQASFRKQGG